MNDDLPPSPALLPSGLRDLLPPDAETEAASVYLLMEAFAAHGYQRVKPPLLEFEDGLLASTGAAMTDQTFRVMDPETHRMMGLRADMTPQVARIDAHRFRDQRDGNMAVRAESGRYAEDDGTRVLFQFLGNVLAALQR